MSEPCKHCWHSTTGSISMSESVDRGQCCRCGEAYEHRVKLNLARKVVEHGPYRPSWVPEKEVV